MLFQVAQTKPNSCNKFNSFKIISAMHRIGNWSDELKNLSLELSELQRLESNFFHSEIEGENKVFFISEDGNEMHMPCSIWGRPCRN